MKVCVIGDVHFSQYSSILRQRGKDFSVRLEKLIDSLNWAEIIAQSRDCEMIIYLGDFFDTSELNAECITALQRVQWASEIEHILITGNHEMGRADNRYSSAMTLSLLPFFNVITEPDHIQMTDDLLFYLMPYCSDTSMPLAETFNKKSELFDKEKTVLFMHNDIKGINYGQYVSTTGYTVDDIESVCDICFNGHIHNEGKLNNIYTVGNLSGQNFSEDATKYRHKITVFDCDTFHVEDIENPAAFNFYKVDDKFDLSMLKNNAVVSLTTTLSADEVNEKLKAYPNIIASKITVPAVKNDAVNDTETVKQRLTVDHIKQFRDYVMSDIGDTSVIKKELECILQ